MREEGGLTAIESAIDKLSKHHIRHIKAYDPNEGKDNFYISQNFHPWEIIWREKFEVEGILIGNLSEFLYSCNNITKTLIQISRLFYFGFFSKINHQMII